MIAVSRYKCIYKYLLSLAMPISLNFILSDINIALPT